jgi:hypothetical protein
MLPECLEFRSFQFGQCTSLAFAPQAIEAPLFGGRQAGTFLDAC